MRNTAEALFLLFFPVFCGYSVFSITGGDGGAAIFGGFGGLIVALAALEGFRRV